MSTSVKEEGAETPREPVAADYFVVVGEFCTWYVSTEMARFIEECLESGAKWVKFVDLIGSRIRLRTRQIEFIAQCTADQRATEREFFRTMRRERKSDKDWDE
jgi:hypothetical protein